MDRASQKGLIWVKLDQSAEAYPCPARGRLLMSASSIEGPDHTVKITHAVIEDLDRHLGWNDKPRSYRLLMAVLHAVWEWSPANAPVSLAAGFPMRLCGTTYEQWPTSRTDIKSRGARDFIARVDLWFRPDPIEDPQAAILAVLDLLSEKVGEEEIEDLRRVLPIELRRLGQSAMARGLYSIPLTFDPDHRRPVPSRRS
jgi:uncharacterized protein (DUF2267 family)